MNEIILCKYGEIVLKGANRSTFEAQLSRALKYRARKYGSFTVRRSQSTVYIEPQNEGCDIDGMYAEAKKVFGLIAVSRAAVCEKSMEAICACAQSYLPSHMTAYKSFKVEAKRSDKTFPLTSPEISAEVGGVILDAIPSLRVDVINPEVVIRVEVRDRFAYIHAGQEHAAGGIPVGSSGRGLLLLSGGIDSPVAGYMMAKRGMYVEALHFESFPYTSERAKEKVLSLAEKLTGYCGHIRVHVISLTHIQEEIRRAAEEDYFTLLLRRYMMKIADAIAQRCECGALITGESLGQVASQTLAALSVTDILATRPVFRPCIGLDKEEIIKTARAIGTYDISVLPYEDCCTVFTPRHPRTRPELCKVEAEENKIDFAALVAEALSTEEVIEIRQEK